MEEQERRKDLVQEISLAMAEATKRGRKDYLWAFSISIGGLVGSFVAAAAAVLKANAEVVGLLALIPGATTTISHQLKLQPHANFHYRLAQSLRSLRTTLLYGTSPDNDPARVAIQLESMRDKMTAEWEDTLGTDTSPQKGVSS